MNNSIGHRARQARKAAGLSQEEVSKKGGPARPTLSRLERDVGQVPERFTIESLARATGVRTAWLLTGEGPMHPTFEEVLERDYGMLPVSAENPTPHQGSSIDAERLAAIIATIQEAFTAKGKKLPPAAFGTLCAEAYLESIRNPNLRGDALITWLQPLVRVALATAR